MLLNIQIHWNLVTLMSFILFRSFWFIMIFKSEYTNIYSIKNFKLSMPLCQDLNPFLCMICYLSFFNWHSLLSHHWFLHLTSTTHFLKYFQFAPFQCQFVNSMYLLISIVFLCLLVCFHSKSIIVFVLIEKVCGYVN